VNATYVFQYNSAGYEVIPTFRLMLPFFHPCHLSSRKRLMLSPVRDVAMLCSEVTHHCTNWTGLAWAMWFGDIISDLLGHHLLGHQADDEGSSSVVLVSHALADSALYKTILGRSMTALQASRYVQVNLQIRLADEQ